MTIHRPRRNEQAFGDRRIAHALGHERKNLRLSTRQPEPITAGRCPQATRNSANAFRSHSFAERLCGGGGAEPFEDFKSLSLFRFGTMPSEQARVLIGTTQALPVDRCGTPIA